ncbi:Harmonin, putative [Pediculus humanus corporis]|uniref:Harmonin, putative n=1 Tax=Pediculus humanus subsp. corporis TaxID=121224 RepID=E0VXP5_PEDHC|nr:Harmonin, putative [Pediculus humanus corporis]EEB18151.1 Harmonin, putative [Pediculus humanus corporis]
MDFNNVKSICHCSSSGSVASSSGSSRSSSNDIPDKRLRTIHLRKETGIYLEGNGKTGNKLYPNVKANSYGFSFRGGKEFGTGFFISVVEKDSEAEYKGLKVGDQIIRINGLPVDDATHREVLQLAQSHHQLTLTVKNVGIIPVKDKSDDPLTWKIVDPNGNNSNNSSNNVDTNQTFGCDVDRIIIEIPESTQLGCGICKGPDWRPGIFVQYTKPNSLARRCGLQPGDQILQCNRISFLQIDFNYAVTVLKGAQTLDLVLKKGSGIDLFPGESSGYSSSSSIADEAVTQNPSKPKRLSMVAEEGDERNGRKSCQCKTGRNSLKPFGSIDSIFDNVSNAGSNYREKSKSIEILTDTNDRKIIDTTMAKVLMENGNVTSVQVHRSDDADVEDDDGYGKNKMDVEKSSSISSFSSGCSLTSAISREIEKRKEVRIFI